MSSMYNTHICLSLSDSLHFARKQPFMFMFFMATERVWHVGSSRTGDQTHIHFIGRWILDCWTAWEVLLDAFY